MDDEPIRRNYREESRRNDHEVRQHVSHQHERVGSEWKVEPGALEIEESYCRYNDEGCTGRIVPEIKNNDECR